MPLSKRIVARLDVKGTRLIKGIRFEGLRVVGDLEEAAMKYAQQGADELLYIDAVASLYGRNTLEETLRSISRRVFIPITAGGGVRSVSDAASLLSAGADKVAVNSAALCRPNIITELAKCFGSQCVVASIQARSIGPGLWEAMGEAGRERSGRDVMEWIREVQSLGAGELLITSVDQDGTCSGPDQDLIQAVNEATNVPTIVGGGFSECEQALNALRKVKISGISIGASLHYNRLEVSAIKSYLKTRLAPGSIRSDIASLSYSRKSNKDSVLRGRKIGIIDYGMGNQQSLINAFEKIGADVLLSSDQEVLNQCSLLALPGVGAFPQGIKKLVDLELDLFISKSADQGKPIIGICLGMQMLFESSDEFGKTKGLGILSGRVTRLPPNDVDGTKLTIPHIGWNNLETGPAWAFPWDLNQPKSQYFVHSYAALDVPASTILLNSYHGNHLFVAAVREKNICGLQFHPERSGASGLEILSLISNNLLQMK